MLPNLRSLSASYLGAGRKDKPKEMKQLSLFELEKSRSFYSKIVSYT